jgi:mono/diheme cytochrome c family protein
MKHVAPFLLGIVTVFSVLALSAVMYVKTADGFSAKAKPSRLEAWLARKARVMAISRNARSQKNPVRNSAEVLSEARTHWADHCAVCHANNGSGEVEMGRHMYPSAPDMRRAETQHMSDGELFYIIEDGIRLSGMPAWGGSDHDTDGSWKLVHFIRHLPELSRAEEREMEGLNPKGPEERKEETEEEQFLKGEDPHGD